MTVIIRRKMTTGLQVLALARELVKLLKGEITVKSTPEKGSTFMVRLPITNKAGQVQKSLAEATTPSAESSFEMQRLIKGQLSKTLGPGGWNMIHSLC